MTKGSQKAKKTEQAVRLHSLQCKGCDKKFFPKDLRQRFHNEECREEYYARTYYHKTSTTKTCPNCGTVFPTSMPKKQKFCNDDCREEYRRKNISAIQDSISKDRVKFYGDRFKTLQNAEFRCSYCGKDASDNIKLDVEPAGKGEYRTICSECVVGKDYTENDE